MKYLLYMIVGLLIMVFGFGFTLGAVYQAYGDGVAGESSDGICVWYFKNGYNKAGIECLEEQEKAREKEKCEKSGRRGFIDYLKT